MKRTSSQNVRLRATGVGIVISYVTRPTVSACIKRAKVRPGSYAADIVTRMWEFYIEGALDVSLEYKTYFQPEYENVEQFLYRKYCMSHPDLERVRDDLRAGQFVGIILGSIRYDGNIRNFLIGKEGSTIAAAVLGASWVD